MKANKIVMDRLKYPPCTCVFFEGYSGKKYVTSECKMHKRLNKKAAN